jgi:hypothetical protein
LNLEFKKVSWISLFYKKIQKINIERGARLKNSKVYKN